MESMRVRHVERKDPSEAAELGNMQSCQRGRIELSWLP
jgi:hypothetical protein